MKVTIVKDGKTIKRTLPTHWDNVTCKQYMGVMKIAKNKDIKDLSKVKVLGIDPSDYMCKLANKKGIRTLSKFFNHQSLKLIKKNMENLTFFMELMSLTILMTQKIS